jgi:hypothetical protein
MKLQLFIEFFVHLVAAEQIRKSVKPAHGDLLTKPD